MRTFSNTGEGIQIGDKVRLVHTANPDNFWLGRQEWMTVVGEDQKDNGLGLKVATDNQRRENSHFFFYQDRRQGFAYIWELKSSTVAYKADQKADEDEDLL